MAAPRFWFHHPRLGLGLLGPGNVRWMGHRIGYLSNVPSEGDGQSATRVTDGRSRGDPAMRARVRQKPPGRIPQKQPPTHAYAKHPPQTKSDAAATPIATLAAYIPHELGVHHPQAISHGYLVTTNCTLSLSSAATFESLSPTPPLPSTDRPSPCPNPWPPPRTRSTPQVTN